MEQTEKKMTEEERKLKEKEAEEKAMKQLNELRDQAIKFDGIAPRGLKNAFKKIPRILEQSKRIGKARSEVYSKKFEEAELKPFLSDFVLGLSEVTAKGRETIGVDSYLDLRGEVADYMAKEGGWGECMGTYYQLDFLFESYPKITQDRLGQSGGYQGMVVAVTAGLKMFNSIAQKLKK